MTLRIEPGTYIIDHGKLLIVDSVDDKNHVHFGDPYDVLSLRYAEENVSPVQKGDTYYKDGHRIEVEELLQHEPDPVVVSYRFDDRDRPFYVFLEQFVNHYVNTPESPFPVGSKVRFRNDVTYTVTSEFDGELIELEPDDDSDKLNFAPDFFELVSPPPPDPGSVWILGDSNVLIREVRDGYVYYTNSQGDFLAVTLKQFGNAFKPYK